MQDGYRPPYWIWDGNGGGGVRWGGRKGFVQIGGHAQEMWRRRRCWAVRWYHGWALMSWLLSDREDTSDCSERKHRSFMFFFWDAHELSIKLGFHYVTGCIIPLRNSGPAATVVHMPLRQTAINSLQMIFRSDQGGNHLSGWAWMVSCVACSSRRISAENCDVTSVPLYKLRARTKE